MHAGLIIANLLRPSIKKGSSAPSPSDFMLVNRSVSRELLAKAQAEIAEGAARRAQRRAANPPKKPAARHRR